MTRPAPTDPIRAENTDEAHWRAWRSWDALPALDLPADGHVVVVAAHPDDEVLGFGGTMALLAAAGVRVTVVALTDGEGSHPRSRVVTPAGLAGIRAEETRTALGRLGAGGARVVRLGLPDTGVADHEEEAVRRLVPLLADARLVAAPWTGDVHADHEAAGRAATEAARIAGVERVLYPVWMWHWARPADPRVPWESAARIALTPEAARRKREAIDCFVSQIHPLGPAPEDAAILRPDEIAHHLRGVEVVFR
ncbi:PIG-L deacetylase family protein [uncultured Streptomyces sp.]|uniref:PIG-L deacetylase family protein n=1 Tax=uncultured Streptomyces sp. TaxID=174707 RepID=UPI00260F25B9|nr:PIG-L deacetylase family protein [uncultured Streptomyces sp.]